MLSLTGAVINGQDSSLNQMRSLPLYTKCQPPAAAGEERLAIAVKALKDADPAKRINATELLVESCHESAIDALIDAISDPDWRVRAAVGRALCSFQISRASNAALNALVNPNDRKITDASDLRARCLTILAINQLRDVRYSRKAIGFLFTFLDFEDPEMRRIAEAAAGELKNTRNGFHELVSIVRQHNYPDFRRKAAIYLGTFPKEQAAEILAEVAANDRDDGVRQAAKDALIRMNQ